MTATTLTVELPDADATVAFGRLLGGALTGGSVVYLSGELGAGKTTLVRGLLRARGHQGAVKSPTYTLIEPYSLDGLNVLHCDLYRLADAGELEYLGRNDLLDEPHLLLVEWPERAAAALPSPDYLLELDYCEADAHGESGRQLRLHACSAAAEVALQALRGRLIPVNGLYRLSETP